ncbi:tetratricopeptide repeat protein [Streptomyces sp. NPDC088748]|uniref:tetratricopeptide repeat protein n=1 Tax=Streptomyces sp. NPDC088748 TaxID=3365887 RepID=UPI0037F1EC1E
MTKTVDVARWRQALESAEEHDHERALRLAAGVQAGTPLSRAARLRAALDLGERAGEHTDRQALLGTLRYALGDREALTSAEAQLLCDLQILTSEFLIDRGRLQEAALLLQEAVRDAGTNLGADSSAVGAVANVSGVVYKALGRFGDAQASYDVAQSIVLEHYGVVSDAYATILHNLAGLAHARGQSAAGLAAGRESVRIRESLHGPDDVLVAADVANLGGLLFDAGHLSEAKACFSRALAIFERELGPHHLEVAVNVNNLAALARLEGDTAGAEKLFRQALAIKERCRGLTHPDTLLTQYNLARHLADLGRVNEARELLDPVLRRLAGLVSEEHLVLRRARSLADRLGVIHDPGACAGGPAA